MIDLRDPHERDVVAGEYVLGTLDAQEHAAFVAALDGDAALQAQVYAWQDHLLGLTTKAAAIEPDPSLWSRIDATLASSSAASPGRSAAMQAAGSHMPVGPGAGLLSWWQRPALWKSISALAVAASFIMALILVNQPESSVGGGARYLAVLQSPGDQTAGWIVEVRTGGTLRLVPLAASPQVPTGRSLQLWTKLEGAAAPTSLGLVKPGQALELPVSALPGVGVRQLFEITLEPEGGSPVDRPTGPILYVGLSVAL